MSQQALRSVVCSLVLGSTLAAVALLCALLQPPHYRGFHRDQDEDGTRWARHYAKVEWPMGFWRPLSVRAVLKAPPETPKHGLHVIITHRGAALADVSVQAGQARTFTLPIGRERGIAALSLQIQSETVAGAAGAEPRGVGVVQLSVAPAGVSWGTAGLLVIGAGVAVAFALVGWSWWWAVALPAMVFTLLAWSERTVVDDAFINFRIVANAWAGHGPVFNVGERVEAGTSVLWLALLYVLGGAVVPVGVQLEWVSVWAGLAAGAFGLALASGAALRLWATDSRGGWPAGVLVVLAVRPFREFVANGLEMGLVFLWLGAVVAVLVRVLDESTGDGRVRAWHGVVVGLGPLVRPDLGLVAAIFLVPLTIRAAWPRDPIRGAVIAAAAAAAPVTVQVLRMGYYASLVPNTALAKEAWLANWPQGWNYLSDFLRPYHLAPVLLILPLAGVCLAMRRPGKRWPVVVLAVSTLAAGVHGWFVLRLGGDFMHARMLLPTVFLLIAPVMLLPRASSLDVTSHRASRGLGVVAGTALVTWTVWCAFWAFPGYGSFIDRTGIALEAAYYRGLAGRPRPVSLEDYESSGFVAAGRRLNQLAESGTRFVAVADGLHEVGPQSRATAVAAYTIVGLYSYAAGSEVHVVDRLGLGDPIASRLRLGQRGRPGHEKLLSEAWVLARFSSDAEGLGRSSPRDAARETLRCAPLATLLAAVTEPMTVERFLENVRLAPALTALRIPNDPEAARRELCGGGTAGGAAPPRN